MRFYVKDPIKRALARSEFIQDCERVSKGIKPKRVLETDIYITKNCNLKCSYCYFCDYFAKPGQSLPTDPSLEQLQQLVDKIDGQTYCLVVLGGEPFCRNDFSEFIRFARAKNIFSIRVSTNGLYLKKKKKILPSIDRLSVSIDRMRANQYPDEMKKLLDDISDVKKELGYNFPKLCLSWTVSTDDHFEDLHPLLDYVISNEFEIKFLPLKVNQLADWTHQKQFVLEALSYIPSQYVTNDLMHTENLEPKFVYDNCLQGIQYYIDFEGKFLYPCDEFPDQQVDSVYDSLSLSQLYEKGVSKFGVYPQERSVCKHCPSGCHSDNSYIFRHPDRQLLDLQ